MKKGCPDPYWHGFAFLSCELWSLWEVDIGGWRLHLNLGFLSLVSRFESYSRTLLICFRGFVIKAYMIWENIATDIMLVGTLRWGRTLLRTAIFMFANIYHIYSKCSETSPARVYHCAHLDCPSWGLFGTINAPIRRVMDVTIMGCVHVGTQYAYPTYEGQWNNAFHFGHQLLIINTSCSSNMEQELVRMWLQVKRHHK